MNNSDGAMAYRPTIGQRFWRKLGFRYHLTDLPDGLEKEFPGWMMTKAFVQFSVADRLRLLLTGRLHLETRHAMNVQVDYAKSAVSFRIEAPGERS